MFVQSSPSIKTAPWGRHFGLVRRLVSEQGYAHSIKTDLVPDFGGHLGGIIADERGISREGPL